MHTNTNDLNWDSILAEVLEQTQHPAPPPSLDEQLEALCARLVEGLTDEDAVLIQIHEMRSGLKTSDPLVYEVLCVAEEVVAIAMAIQYQPARISSPKRLQAYILRYESCQEQVNALADHLKHGMHSHAVQKLVRHLQDWVGSLQKSIDALARRFNPITKDASPDSGLIDKVLHVSVQVMQAAVTDEPFPKNMIKPLIAPMDRVTECYTRVCQLLDPNTKVHEESGDLDVTRWLSIVAIMHVRAFLDPQIKTEFPDYSNPKHLVHTLATLPQTLVTQRDSLSAACQRNNPEWPMDYRVKEILEAFNALVEQRKQDTQPEAFSLIDGLDINKQSGEMNQYCTALYADVHLQPLPKNLGSLQAQLIQESPWLASVTERIFRSIYRNAASRRASERLLPPLVLVGSPGCGKTHFLQRLAELLEIPTLLLAIGGMADNTTLRGTPRGYNSARPGLPVQFIVESGCANPLLILDELDKAGTGRHNGNPLDSLLQLLEPNNARRFFDECLQIRVDLSHVSFVGTANQVDTIPKTIRDRVLLIPVPDPSIDDLRVMAYSRWSALLREVGYPDPAVMDYPAAQIEHRLRAKPSLRALDRWLQEWVSAYVSWQLQPMRLH